MVAQMFASEAILWSTLKHRNITPFLGIVKESPLDIGLVSEFFKNGNIKHYLKNVNRRADLRALDIARGLRFIHGQEPPIFHGDLKGDNVLVNDHGQACLSDFGQSFASDSRMYLDSSRVGRPGSNPLHWMAPELMREGVQIKVTAKSDMYAFGCVLYEMIVGKMPFENDPPGAVREYVLRGDRPGRPDLGGRTDLHLLWTVAESCWRENAHDRPEAMNVVSRLRLQ
ncbi:kinase-like protein [Melanogaster broomeanus]|nr:kinase-like protein [Melanogaster broomeanus]